MAIPVITLTSDAFVSLDALRAPSSPVELIASVEGNIVLAGIFSPAAEQAPATVAVNVTRRPAQTPGTRGAQETDALYTFGEVDGDPLEAGDSYLFLFPLSAPVNGIGGGGARYAMLETLISSGPATLADFAYCALRWVSPRLG